MYVNYLYLFYYYIVLQSIIYYNERLLHLISKFRPQFYLDDEVYNICQDAILAEPHGYITSPGYPQDYPSRTECRTTIEIDPGQYIVFTSHRMLLEADDG